MHVIFLDLDVNLKSLNIDILNMFTINWIKPLYQPIVDMQSGKIVSIEVFARLEHPEMGLLNQIYFIPILRKINLLNLLYIEMLENTILNTKKFNLDFNFSINAEYSLFKNDLSSITNDICNKHDFDPSKLTIDLINDGSLITQDIEINLNKIKHIGVKLMSNAYDFTISNINVSFDYLKIDRRLISELINKPKSLHIIEMLFNTSKLLNAKCIAEGIENEKTWFLLKEIGVHLAQGYYISNLIDIKSLANTNIDSYKYLVNNNTRKVLVVLKNKTFSNMIENELSCLIPNLTFIIPCNKTDFCLHLDECVFDCIITDSSVIEYFKKNDYFSYRNIKKFIFLYDSAPDFDLNEEIKKPIFIKNRIKQLDTINSISEHLINFNEKVKLSHQEKVVIDYLMNGITNKQISAKMNLSEKTVSAYKKRALSKLNVKSIVELCNKNIVY